MQVNDRIFGFGLIMYFTHMEILKPQMLWNLARVLAYMQSLCFSVSKKWLREAFWSCQLHGFPEETSTAQLTRMAPPCSVSQTSAIVMQTQQGTGSAASSVFSQRISQGVSSVDAGCVELLGAWCRASVPQWALGDGRVCYKQPQKGTKPVLLPQLSREPARHESKRHGNGIILMNTFLFLLQMCFLPYIGLSVALPAVYWCLAKAIMTF